MLRIALSNTSGRVVTDTVQGAGSSVQGAVTFTSAGKAWIVAGAPDVFANGLPLKHTGELCVHDGGTINHFQNGLPFTTADRLVIVASGTVAYYCNGLPFDTNDRLCTE